MWRYNILLDCIRIESTYGNFGIHEQEAISVTIIIFDVFVIPFLCTSPTHMPISQLPASALFRLHLLLYCSYIFMYLFAQRTHSNDNLTRTQTGVVLPWGRGGRQSPNFGLAPSPNASVLWPSKYSKMLRPNAAPQDPSWLGRKHLPHQSALPEGASISRGCCSQIFIFCNCGWT